MKNKLKYHSFLDFNHSFCRED